MTKTKMRTKEDAILTNLAEAAGILLDDGHWGNLQPLSERDVLALTIMRDCLSPKLCR